MVVGNAQVYSAAIVKLLEVRDDLQRRQSHIVAASYCLREDDVTADSVSNSETSSSADERKFKPTVDFGKAASDYSRYRQGFPDDFMAKLSEHGIGLPFQRVVDIGTGTGLLAFAFDDRGCRTYGLDPSPALLEKARERASAENRTIDFIEGRAERTGLQESAFDVVSVATAWHWFDRPAAAREARRILKRDGRLLIAVLEWHVVPENVLGMTKELIDRYLPGPSKAIASSPLLPLWGDELIDAGFGNWEAFSHVAPLHYTHEQWRGRVRASQAVRPRMSEDEVARFDADLAAILQEHFPADSIPIPHRVSAVIASNS